MATIRAEISLSAAQISVLLCHPHHCIPSAASFFFSSCISRVYRANTSPRWDSITPLMSPPSLAESEAAGKAEASFIPALSQICLQGKSKGGTGLLYLLLLYHIGKGVLSVAWCWAEQGSFYIHAGCTCSGWAFDHSTLRLSCRMPNQLWVQPNLAPSLWPACRCVFYSLILKLSRPWHILSASSWFSHEKNEPS